MRVTIITDASYCPDTNVAGYGYWIACERGKQGGGGEMKSLVDGSVEAEMQAIVNAVHIAASLSLVQAQDDILIQTDCMAAIDAFRGTRKVLKKQELEAVYALSRLRCKHGLGIGFKHVKGHSNNTDARSITNKLCDKRAKESMKRARARIKLEN